MWQRKGGFFMGVWWCGINKKPLLRELQRWFADFYGDMWDKQIESDVNSGKLDNLAAQALAEYNDGKATEF